jgi:hypothetical protein
MAREVGLHPVYICQLETGVHRIGLHAAGAVYRSLRDDCDRLGYSFEDLLAGTPPA